MQALYRRRNLHSVPLHLFATIWVFHFKIKLIFAGLSGDSAVINIFGLTSIIFNYSITILDKNESPLLELLAAK